MKKVLVISTSLRARSNSEALADEFVRGALEAGNEVEKVTLKGKDIHFCKGCLVCQKTQKCVIKDDDAPEIVRKMYEADAICFATPIYYYEMSGQMKTLIDRVNSLYYKDYKFRKVYLLATATEDEPYTVEGTKKGVQGWVDCFDGVEFSGTLFVGGVTGPSDINGNEKLKDAFNLGKSIK